MCRRRWASALASLFCLLCLCSWSLEARPVRVGIFPAAPLVFVKEGQPGGLFIDLVKYFSRTLDWRVDYVEGTWAELQSSLEKGDIDLLPAVGHNSERARKYDFSRNPVYIDSGVLFVGRKFVLHTVFDLEGKRVAALKGSLFTTGFIDLMSSFGLNCDMVLTDDNRAVMEAITKGEADAGVCIYSLGNELAREYPVAITPIAFSPIALEFAVAKGRNADLIEGIDRLMAAMIDDPGSVYSRSYLKWTAPPESRAIPAWTWWGIVGLAGVGLIFGAWSFLLRRTVAQKTRHLSEEIADRKRAVEELAAEKERIAVTLRSIADGVITTDTDGNIEIMNKVAEALCGWTQKEAEGKPLSSVFTIMDEITREPRERIVDEVIAKGRTIELSEHTLLVSRDGTERAIAQSGALIKDADSVTVGVVLVFRDVSEKRKMLETIQRTDKLESLGVLAGGIAHDFNNLLAGIFGYLSAARNAGVADPMVVNYLDKALSVFDRAKNLAQQLLTFSAGGSPLRKTGQIGPLVKETVSFAASGSNIECEFSIAEDLGLCDYDGNQMGQVFDNLILNARQAMPLGGTIRVAALNVVLQGGEVPSLKPGRYIKITVADSGAGIPLELQKHIFDPFFTTKETGHGLGLATCNSIVGKHRGAIDFESKPGAGTTFRLFLPESTGSMGGDHASLPVEHRGTGTILVMDDEDFIREIVDITLRSMGYAVLVAGNGEEALKLCAEAMSRGGSVLAAILDLTVHGGMGGKETARILHERYPNLPVFASSGYSEDPVMSNPLDYGFADSIRKPYVKAELADLLRKHLGKERRNPSPQT